MLGRQRPRTEARAQEAQWRRRGSHCAAAAIVSVRRGSGAGAGAQCGGGGGTQWPDAAAMEVARTPKRLTAETGDGGENTGKLKVAAAWFTLCCCGGDVSVRCGGGDGAGAQCGGGGGTQWPNAAATVVATEEAPRSDGESSGNGRSQEIGKMIGERGLNGER